MPLVGTVNGGRDIRVEEGSGSHRQTQNTLPGLVPVPKVPYSTIFLRPDQYRVYPDKKRRLLFLDKRMKHVRVRNHGHDRVL